MVLHEHVPTSWPCSTRYKPTSQCPPCPYAGHACHISCHLPGQPWGKLGGELKCVSRVEVLVSVGTTRIRERGLMWKDKLILQKFGHFVPLDWFGWVIVQYLPPAQNLHDSFKIKEPKRSSLMVPRHQTGGRCQKLQVNHNSENQGPYKQSGNKPQIFKAFYLVSTLLWLFVSSPSISSASDAALQFI